MSSETLEQPELDAFGASATVESEAEPQAVTVEHDEPFEGAAFRPDLREGLDVKTGATASPQLVCEGCDTPVTPGFARVFADNDGVVWACPDCEDVDRSEIYRGAASGREHGRGGRL